MTSSSVIDQRIAILLLVVHRLGEIKGRTRLQKIIFLMQREGGYTDNPALFNFIPYNYGPFSRQLDDYMFLAKQLGLIEEQQYIIDTPYGQVIGYRFKTTAHGEELAERVIKTTQNPLPEEFLKVASKYIGWDLKRLLEYVYAQYPYMARQPTK